VNLLTNCRISGDFEAVLKAVRKGLVKKHCKKDLKKELASSGKSPAYIHRRKSFAEQELSPRREIGGAFLFEPAFSF
jgi:hypothetical protein